MLRCHSRCSVEDLGEVADVVEACRYGNLAGGHIGGHEKRRCPLDTVVLQVVHRRGPDGLLEAPQQDAFAAGGKIHQGLVRDGLCVMLLDVLQEQLHPLEQLGVARRRGRGGGKVLAQDVQCLGERIARINRVGFALLRDGVPGMHHQLGNRRVPGFAAVHEQKRQVMPAVEGEDQLLPVARLR